MKVHVYGQADTFTGYGLHTLAVLNGLAKRGHDVTFSAYQTDRIFPLPPIMDEQVPYQDGLLLQVSPPNVPVIPGAVLWTMHETSHLPDYIHDNLRAASKVLVPAFPSYLKEQPFKIAPLGIDKAVFTPGLVDRNYPIVFGTGGSISHAGARKNIPGVIQAFKFAFPELRSPIPWNNCRLQIKILPWDEVEVDDPRITVDKSFKTETELAEWYRGLDCFVSLSRGEGFNLMPLQAINCGAMAVTLGPVSWGNGLHDVIEVKSRPEPVPRTNTFYSGYWLGYDELDAAAALRNAAARCRVVLREENVGWSWDDSINHLVNLLQDL